MAQDIVSGLFGLSPYQVAQQQQREIDTDAAKFAQMNAAQRGTMGLYQGGAGLAGMAGGMLGIENPAMVEAQQRQAALQGLDISSPESILARAQQIQDPKLKMQLMMVARDAQAKQQQMALEAAKVKREEFKMDEEFKWKQQQAKDALEQKAEAARLRSEDMRLAIDQRREAAREAANTRAMIAKLTTSVTGSDEQMLSPETVDFYAKQQLLTGDQSWRTGLGRSKHGVELILAVDKRIPKLAEEVGMTPEQASENKQEFANRAKSLRDFSTGPQGKTVTAFNTAIDHLETLRELGSALKNGNMQATNIVANKISQWTGQPAPVSFDAAKQIVGQEVVKAIVQGGGGVTERQEAAQKISSANSPDQLLGVIDTYQKLMGGQLASLSLQYETTTKRKDFDTKLTPAAQKFLQKKKPESTPTGKSGIKFLGFE